MQYSKSGGRYIVSPYAILWNDGSCYLYAYEEEKARFSHFRIDRMEDTGFWHFQEWEKMNTRKKT